MAFVQILRLYQKAGMAQLAGAVQELSLPLAHLDRMGWIAWSAAISWIVLRPLIASMATLALNSGL